MSNIEWVLEHSENTDTSLEFAWDFWSDVKNWDDPPAKFVLEEPFAEGSRGMTLIPDQDPVHWSIRTVRERQSFATEMPLEGAMMVCEWSFEPISERQTRLTQRLGLYGENASQQAQIVRHGFGPTLAQGMRRIADLIAEAEVRGQRG